MPDSALAVEVYDRCQELAKNQPRISQELAEVEAPRWGGSLCCRLPDTWDGST